MDHKKSFSEYFDCKEAKFAQKSLDYLDGKQLEYVIKLLDEPTQGRREWRDRGMRPSSRNLTNMVIEKSALLFMNQPPQQEIFVNRDATTSDEELSQKYNDILESSDWDEFMQNVDQVVRLLKTAVILTQYDEYDDSLMLDCLHRGNSYVRINPHSKKPVLLVYKTYEDEYEEYCYYRVFTEEKIEDWREKESTPGRPPEPPELVSTQDNPYGRIPMTTFYDTNTPRVGYWNVMPTDLIGVNESYNLHLVDTEFGASWNIHKTLFTNCEITNSISGSMQVSEQYKQPLPRQSVANDGALMGLSKIVHLDTTGVDSPFVEFKGPDLDLEQTTKLFATWVRDFASDWSVNVKLVGEGVANSGFQLIVEEFDNLELRKIRAKMFTTGLERMFDTIKDVWNYHYPATFPEDSYCGIVFALPSLPVETKSQEEVWTSKINQKRATPIDYYMEVLGLTKEEANAKWEETVEFYENNDGSAAEAVVEDDQEQQGSPQPQDSEEYEVE